MLIENVSRRSFLTASHSDTAVDAESILSIKSRFAPVLADAAQAIVDEAMSAASKAERRIAPTEVKHILEGIDRGVISFDGNRIRFANDPLRVCSLFALNREYFLQISAFIALMADYRYPPTDANSNTTSWTYACSKTTCRGSMARRKHPNAKRNCCLIK